MQPYTFMTDIEKKLDRNTEHILNRLDDLEKRFDTLELQMNDVLAFAEYVAKTAKTDFTIKKD